MSQKPPSKKPPARRKSTDSALEPSVAGRAPRTTPIAPTLPPDYSSQGFKPPEPPWWRRPGCLIPMALLALVVCIVLAGLLSFYVAHRKDYEESASRTTPEPIPTGTTVTDIGSGGSVQTSWYQLYFTAPKYPDNPANHRGGLDEKLIALLDTAKTSIDMADYDFDLANVADAMARAKARGVTVRMVTDTDTLTNTKNQSVVAAFAIVRAANIPIVDDNRGPIMHNKFTVVDQQWIQTGSWNYTDGDTYRLNNNMIIINSRELAANYSAEFAKMFERRQFGPTKDKAIPYPVVTINGTRIETCFASENRCADRINATIATSTTSIQFLAFSFTSDSIEQAMIARSRAGVVVSGVVETTGSQTPFSAYTKLKAQGIPVYTDGNPWVMHHKVIIIDERIVIFGSFNFSDNANTQNDENLLIVDNPEIAKAFKAEFDRVLALAQNPPAKK